MAGSADNHLQARNDLAWAISVGGIGVVLFAGLLVFVWYFAATLFLIFAGILLGVALHALTNKLGRVVKLPHSLRLTIVCLVLAGLLSGVVFLGGATIAQQATALSGTIKSQLANVKAFLDRNGLDTGYFGLGTAGAQRIRPHRLRKLARRRILFRVRERLPQAAARSSAKPSNCCWARLAPSAISLSSCFWG